MSDPEELRGEERGWEPGEYDKASSGDSGLVLVGYTVLVVVLALLVPGLVCSSIFLTGFLVGLWVLLFVMFIMARFSGTDIAVQRRRFFDMGPDRLSRVVQGALDGGGIRYLREGPAEREPDIWSDRFTLSGHPWGGIQVLVERDGLIARESPCRATVQCGERKDPLLDELQDRIDRAAKVEHERGQETRGWKVYSKYVVPPHTGLIPTPASKPYEPRDP